MRRTCFLRVTLWCTRGGTPIVEQNTDSYSVDHGRIRVAEAIEEIVNTMTKVLLAMAAG